MAQLTAEKLAQRAFDIGLLDERQLREVWAALGSRNVETEELLQLLVRREFLTNYQVERLRKGERGGYFFGPYKVLYLVGTGTFARVYRAAQVVTPGGSCPADTMPLRPVGPILCAAGLGPQTMALLQDKLKPFGLEAVATGGAPAKPAALSLQPGAALGVRLMEGDFDITGIGTVTYRQGNRLLGFGHPMMQRGRVAMPICTAWIHDFLPNLMRSNKLGSGVADLGTLQADTAWAVGGQVGPLPTRRPANIEILDRSRNLRRQFHIKVLDEPGLTSALMLSGIAAASKPATTPASRACLPLGSRSRVRGAPASAALTTTTSPTRPSAPLSPKSVT